MLSSIDQFIMRRYRLIWKYKDIFLLNLLRPVAKLGVIADSVSIVGLLSGICSAIFLHYSKVLFVVFWLGKRSADIIDGPISKLNKAKIFRGINVDRFCDITFTIILFISTIPLVGTFLPIVAITTHVLHIKFDISGMGGESLFAPGNYAQYFFIFGFFKEGLVVQVILTTFAFIIRRIMGKEEVV